MRRRRSAQPPGAILGRAGTLRMARAAAVQGAALLVLALCVLLAHEAMWLAPSCHDAERSRIAFEIPEHADLRAVGAAAGAALDPNPDPNPDPGPDPDPPGPPRLGLVLPFIDAQVETRLLPSLLRWTEEGSHPCAAARADRLPVDVFFFHPETTSEGEARIRRAWEELQPHVRDCIGGGMELLFADLPPQLARNHPAGPCSQFYALFEKLRGRARYFFVMEPDAIPVRSGWLEALYREAAEVPGGSDRGCNFWIKGSPPLCDGTYGAIFQRRDMHINGNALYCIDDGILDYFERVKRFYPAESAADVHVPGCATGNGGESGHDHCIFQFLQDPRNSAYARRVLHNFRYTDAVLNLCEESYDEEELREAHPRTVIVHSKAPYFTSEERVVRDVYWRTVRRFPGKEEMKAALASGARRLRGGGGGGGEDLSAEERAALVESVARIVCRTDEFQSWSLHNGPSEVCTELCLSDAEFRRVYIGGCWHARERHLWQVLLPPEEVYYAWTVDFHGAPAACNAGLLAGAGVQLHAEVDYGNCKYFHNCRDRLKVLHNDNNRGFGLDPCPNAYRRAFHRAYMNDEEFRRVDFFFCSHPQSNCELFMPFNRSIVVLATTRLDFGRGDSLVEWRAPDITEQTPRRWREWVQNLRRIAAQPGNIIAANNRYDAAYIHYHTGISAQYLPSSCVADIGRATFQYLPTRTEVLIGMYRDNLQFSSWATPTGASSWEHPVLQGLRQALESHGGPSPPTFARMADLYPEYEWSDIVQHPAVVLVPYQVSTMSLFELYGTGVPIFAPSLDLLVRWVSEHGIMWERKYGTPERVSGGGGAVPSPHDDDEASLRHWLALCDFYTFPHVQLFDSWPHLLELLRTTNLHGTSRNMRDHFLAERRRLRTQWKMLLDSAFVARHGPDRNRKAPLPSGAFDDVMAQLFGAPQLPPDPPDRTSEKCRSLEADPVWTHGYFPGGKADPKDALRDTVHPALLDLWLQAAGAEPSHEDINTLLAMQHRLQQNEITRADVLQHLCQHHWRSERERTLPPLCGAGAKDFR